MPVYNGERYLRQSIESILGQTFQDFKLIISDNASTDNTEEICRQYAKQDSRVLYYRNKTNIGGPLNYNRVFKLSSSKYFKWAAYDDVLAPDFLKKCVSVLDNDSSVVGCHCLTGRIDQNGNFLGYYNSGLLNNIGSNQPHKRFRDLIGLFYTTTPFHGVYRSNMFAKSQLHGSYIGADRNLVAELSLMGRIYQIPECLFYWREHPSSYTSMFYGSTREDSLDRLQKEAAWWSKSGGTYFPHWKTCLEYYKSVHRVDLSIFERFSCYLAIFDWFAKEGRRFMAKDLLLFQMQHSNFATKLLQKAPYNLKRRVLPYS
jgi:glycosyltransferase involved in cell wall biosynthesis